jgi:hypothetical protein
MPCLVELCIVSWLGLERNEAHRDASFCTGMLYLRSSVVGKRAEDSRTDKLRPPTRRVKDLGSQ